MLLLDEEINGAGYIAISGHIRPDGDCIGACMALYMYLKKIVSPGVKVSVFLEKTAPVFADIPHIGEIKTSVPEGRLKEVPDVMFALDCDKSRLGMAERLFEAAGKRINIDHHISNRGCGDVNYIDTSASSTSELVYELIDKGAVDSDIAMALYIGIIHDTGVFQYSNTSKRTMEIGAELIGYDFDHSLLVERTFNQKSYVQNLMLGRALTESILFLSGKCIVSGVTRKMMEFYGAVPGDFTGIVAQLRNTKGIECAIFMYELDVLEYKVSLRSTDNVDVSAIAEYFGGGGHKKAAGCTMSGTYHDVINNLSRQIEMQLKEKGIL